MLLHNLNFKLNFGYGGREGRQGYGAFPPFAFTLQNHLNKQCFLVHVKLDLNWQLYFCLQL